jgi:hypothetical protein
MPRASSLRPRKNARNSLADSFGFANLLRGATRPDSDSGRYGEKVGICRGVLGAIEDYTRVIESASDTDRNKAMAYFNRGNSKPNLADEAGACEDWHKALQHGADYARERIDEHCAR